MVRDEGLSRAVYARVERPRACACRLLAIGQTDLLALFMIVVH